MDILLSETTLVKLAFLLFSEKKELGPLLRRGFMCREADRGEAAILQNGGKLIGLRSEV